MATHSQLNLPKAFNSSICFYFFVLFLLEQLKSRIIIWGKSRFGDVFIMPVGINWEDCGASGFDSEVNLAGS